MSWIPALEVVREGRVAMHSCITPREEVTRIGRDARGSSSLDDAHVSRIPCCIAADQDGCVVEAMGRANETLLEGCAIQYAPLKNRDVITAGPFEVYASISRPSPRALESLGFEPVATQEASPWDRCTAQSREPTLVSAVAF